MHTRICLGHFDLAALVSIIIFYIMCIIGPGDEASSSHLPVKIRDALEILDVNLGDSVDELRYRMDELRYRTDTDDNPGHVGRQSQ